MTVFACIVKHDFPCIGIKLLKFRHDEETQYMLYYIPYRIIHETLLEIFGPA